MGWRQDAKEMRDLSVGHAEKAEMEERRGNPRSAALHRQLSAAAARDVDEIIDKRGSGS